MLERGTRAEVKEEKEIKSCCIVGQMHALHYLLIKQEVRFVQRRNGLHR